MADDGVTNVVQNYFGMVFELPDFIVHYLFDYYPIRSNRKNEDTYTLVNFKQGRAPDNIRRKNLENLKNHLREFIENLPGDCLIALIPSSTPGKSSPFLEVCEPKVTLTRTAQVQKATEGNSLIIVREYRCAQYFSDVVNNSKCLYF